MAAKQNKEDIASSFRSELERLLDLPEGAAQDLDMIRTRRDALRQRADDLLDQAMHFEAKRDAVLESMRKKSEAIKALRAAGEDDDANELKAAMRAEYEIGAGFDKKAGELMDAHFEVMGLESEVSSFFSVLARMAKDD